MLPYTDPRVRMRDAVRTLVHANGNWSEPTLEIFRNRLLDLTGSDARPLAELLVEALRRGWRERMRERALSTPEWDAIVAPFIMQWSAERFVQPDMARWAVECWGAAFGVIREDQLRIAPPRPPAPVAGSLHAGHARAITKPSATATRATIAATPTLPTVARTALRASTHAPTRIPNTASHRPWYAAPHAPSRSAVRHVNPWLSRVLLGTLGTAGFALVTYVSMTASSQTLPRTARALVAADTSAAPTPGIAPAVAPGTRRPGVPSVTSELAARAVVDSTRMMFVEPARRASGSSRLIAPAPAGVSVALDQIRLADGTRMMGRVEILRAGSVIFRDVTTGLRHEIAKDDVDEIITEFGTSVRFGESGGARRSGRPSAPDARSATVVPAVRETGPRARGVGGRYVIRYAAATATGSRECTAVWQRAPNTVDRATVEHRIGADTLAVVFDGGDTFQSNIDRRGYFASTFRIVPDQARSSTALTTRLTGQFTETGGLVMQVNIVFFRRMRSGGDIACNVTVNAVGTKEAR